MVGTVKGNGENVDVKVVGSSEIRGVERGGEERDSEGCVGVKTVSEVVADPEIIFNGFKNIFISFIGVK